jgi:hypothetical protein
MKAKHGLFVVDSADKALTTPDGRSRGNDGLARS